MTDEIPKNVFNVRGDQLYMAKDNKLAFIVQTLDQPVSHGHLAMLICHVCNSQGKVVVNQALVPQNCPMCNGFGHLFKMLNCK